MLQKYSSLDWHTCKLIKLGEQATHARSSRGRQVHLNRRPCADDINLREIAFETQRYSGAQLANLVNLAASFVGRAGRDRITHADMLEVGCARHSQALQSG